MNQKGKYFLQYIASLIDSSYEVQLLNLKKIRVKDENTTGIAFIEHVATPLLYGGRIRIFIYDANRN